jgi:hypothetical protein
MREGRVELPSSGTQPGLEIWRGQDGEGRYAGSAGHNLSCQGEADP